MFFVNHRVLTADATDSPAANRKQLISQLACANGVKTYSEAIKVDRNVGFLSILAKEDAVSTAGDVDIYMEYSWDGTNWYRANTTAAGALTQEADVVTTLANATKWIVVTARLAKWARVVIDPDADSRVTLTFAFQEES